jgi:transposase
MLVICEATGGYENAVLKAAAELGLNCHLAHGSSVRAYAKFRGRHAKSDPIDAALIAEYGRDKPDLRLYQPPRPEEAALRALMGRRAELKDMIQAETSRLEHASLKAVRVSLESHLAALKGQLALIEKEIRAITRLDEAFNHQSRLMQTLAGIGAVASQTILAFFPEIGHIPSSAAVALAGLALRPTGTTNRWPAWRCSPSNSGRCGGREGS